MSRRRSAKRILFLGTHGQRNWGDELLLDVFTNQLAPAASRFYVNSYDPLSTAAFLHGKNAVVFNTKTDRLKLLRYLVQCEALVFGGGSIVKELYTAYGGAKYATLQVLDTLTKIAKLLGKPIYFCNIGVGPVDTDQGRSMAVNILNRGSALTVRDGESVKLLETLPLTVPFRLASDAVFSIDREYLQLPAAKKTPHAGVNDETTIGINLCRNISNNENWPYFMEQLTRDLTAWLKAHPRTKIVGLPMQYDVANNDDAAVLDELGDRLRAALPKLDFTILRPKSIAEYARVIDGLDCLVAERLHALILSIIIGTPLVALEYDMKVTGIIGDVGLSEFGLDINKPFAPGTIHAKLAKAFAAPDRTRAQLQAAYQKQHDASAASFREVIEALGQ